MYPARTTRFLAVSALGAVAIAALAGCISSRDFVDRAEIDAGVDGGQAAPQLIALEPAIANTGDLITLEGTFSAPMAVQFPGDVSAPATVLGAHRATVVVPMGATAGDLTVATDDGVSGPLRFRRASFELGMQTFRAEYDQTQIARHRPHLITARYRHSSVVIGKSLYVIGGADSAGRALGSVERATINADGSLGPFVTTSVSLGTSRQSHTSVVVGSWLYVLGGFDGASTAFATVERAVINDDDSIGPFSSTGITLVIARWEHASVVVGSSLYVLGGSDRLYAPLRSVERAIVGADGSLGRFETVASVSLVRPSAGHTCGVIGSWLYVLGGERGGLGTIQRAIINPDGSLGAFLDASVALAVPRTSHVSAVIGNQLYAIGGDSASGSLNSVEVATISSDGSLSTFGNAPGVALSARRYDHTSEIIGNYLYVLGGRDQVGVDDRVEHAQIVTSGGFSAFETSSGTALVAEHYFHKTVVLGNSTYVIGGGSDIATTLATVERATLREDGSIGSFGLVAPLAAARSGFSVAVVGSSLYLVGGLGQSAVAMAPIGRNGSLGSFTTVAGVTLLTSRWMHTSAIVGNFLYVIGGAETSLGTVLSSVERAAINPDGSLGPFESVAGGLTTPRFGHTSAVIGGFLYVIGGNDASVDLDSVERAAVLPDGSLGTFTSVPGVRLTSPRIQYTSAVVGNWLYAIAGRNGSVFWTSIERAAIGADGSLGPLATVAAIAISPARYGQTTTVIGNFLHVIGGSDPPTGSLSSIERATLQ